MNKEIFRKLVDVVERACDRVEERNPGVAENLKQVFKSLLLVGKDGAEFSVKKNIVDTAAQLHMSVIFLEVIAESGGDIESLLGEITKAAEKENTEVEVEVRKAPPSIPSNVKFPSE